MNNEYVSRYALRKSRDVLRKRKEREMETVEERETRLSKDRGKKQKMIETETEEQREKRLRYQREKIKQRRATSKMDRKLLEKFRNKMDKIQHVVCPVCNECCLSTVIVMGKCRRCHSEKIMPNKFSAENNMDPGNVPNELEGMTEIEEMLIAKVFTVMSVYRLRGGQYGYRGNVINFPQDVEEFTTRLPREPSSLEVLVV